MIYCLISIKTETIYWYLVFENFPPRNLKEKRASIPTVHELPPRTWNPSLLITNPTLQCKFTSAKQPSYATAGTELKSTKQRKCNKLYSHMEADEWLARLGRTRKAI